jgi:ASC-1-like (ASCH) protein
MLDSIEEVGMTEKAFGVKEEDPAVVFEFNVVNVEVTHIRRYEKFLDVLAKLGGLLKFLSLFFSMMLAPISRL